MTATSLLEDVRKQRRAIGARVPVYDRILALVEHDTPLVERLEAAWRDRAFFAFYDRPLLLLASLRFDALAQGESHPLWRAIAVPSPEVSAATGEALAEATAPGREQFWRTVRERAVQTNETSRAVAWLWPARLAGVGAGRRVALIDVGASAGLNLVADELASLWRSPDGAPLPVAPPVVATARLGLDRSPLDARTAEGARWLTACVWAGERAREERLAAAIAAFRGAAGRPDAPIVQVADARDFPARCARLVTDVGDTSVFFLAYQSILREYLSPEARDVYGRGMHAWLASLPPGSAAWVELELVRGAEPDLPAAIVAHVHRGGGEIAALPLARCAYHPHEIVADATAVEEYRAIVGG